MNVIDSEDGFFHDGNHAAGLRGTPIKAVWLNGIQGEILNVIAAAGLSPDPTDSQQLLKAVCRLAGVQVPGGPVDPTPTDPTDPVDPPPDPTPTAPTLTGFVHTIQPLQEIGSVSTVMIYGTTASDGSTDTYSIDTGVPGIEFSKTSGIAVGEQFTISARVIVGEVLFNVRATTPTGGLLDSKVGVRVIDKRQVIEPVGVTFAHNVPASIPAGGSVTVQFSGVMSAGASPPYSIDAGSSGLSFSRLAGILQYTAVRIDAPAEAVGQVSFSVMMTDNSGHVWSTQVQVRVV